MHRQRGLKVKQWKKKTARKWIEAAHENGLKAHIARPWDIWKADVMGADSVDTTSIVAWANWERLKKVENKAQTQTTL